MNSKRKMKVIPEEWLGHLAPEYTWLAEVTSEMDACGVVTEFLEGEEYEDGEHVDAFTSSVWGLCHAFLDFKSGVRTITEEELAYLATRGGDRLAVNRRRISEKKHYSLKDFLFDLDPSFRAHLLCTVVTIPTAA